MDHRKIFLLSNGSGYPFFSFLFFFPSVLSLLFDFSYGRLTSKHFIIHKFHVDVNIQIHINVDAKKKKKKITVESTPWNCGRMRRKSLMELSS